MKAPAPDRDPYFADISTLLCPLLLDYYGAAERLIEAEGTLRSAALPLFLEVREAIERFDAGEALPPVPESIAAACWRISEAVVCSVELSTNTFILDSDIRRHVLKRGYESAIDALHRIEGARLHSRRRFPRWLNLFRWRRNREEAHPQPDRRPGVPAVRVLAPGGTQD